MDLKFATHNIRTGIKHGCRWEYLFQFQDSLNLALLTDAKLQVRATLKHKPLLTLSLGSGITKSGQNLSIAVSDTTMQIPAGKYRYDIILTIENQQVALCEGDFWIHERYTA